MNGYCCKNRTEVEKNRLSDADGAHGSSHYYENGNKVEKDKLKASDYYQKSANIGHSDLEPQDNLGLYYQHGIGVDKDEQKVFIYHQKSANMDNDNGLVEVGHRYQDEPVVVIEAPLAEVTKMDAMMKGLLKTLTN